MNDKDKSYFTKLILSTVIFASFLTVFGLVAQFVMNKSKQPAECNIPEGCPPYSDTENTKASVIIKTDKLEYKQSDAVKIKIQNYLSQSIGYWDYSGQITPFINIQKFQNGKWESIKGQNVCVCKNNCTTHANGWVELKSNELINDSWNTKIDCTGKTVSEGKYRVWFSYNLDLTGQGKKFTDVYSEEFNIIKNTENETADWKIYNNPEANFTFKYPNNWEITADYFYETAAGSKATDPTVILQKIGNSNANDEITINARQFSCEGSGKCANSFDNRINAYVGTRSENPEILEIFDKIVNSFEKKDETADWKIYINKKYKYSFKHPQDSTVSSNQYATNSDGAFNVSLTDSNIRFHIEAQDTEMYLNGPSLTIIETMKLPLKDFVQEIWRQNKEDKNPYIKNKEVGEISNTTVGGKIAYQFTLTGSYHDERGGYSLKKKYLYLFVENNGLNFMIWFPADDLTSPVILKSFKFISQ